MTASLPAQSQAASFSSFLDNGVDERTGQYTLSIKIPEIQCNAASGPGYAFALVFSPMNSTNSGFGMGWDTNLTHFTPGKKILSLNTGERFKVTGSTPNGTPVFKEKKLDTFHFSDEGGGTYRVTHRTGLVEILKTGGSIENEVALPHEIYAPSGHKISLTYVSVLGVQMLNTISDDMGVVLKIVRNDAGTRVNLLLHPDGGSDGGPRADYRLEVNSGRLEYIHLPASGGYWHLGYETKYGVLHITEVNTPSGGRETVEYLDDGHSFPGNSDQKLPRVTRHCTFPGFGQPVMETTYLYYSSAQNNHHNFLGNGATVSVVEGMDSLYNVTHTYNYGTTIKLVADGKEVRNVVRTFNRFHLLTEEVTTQNHCVKRVLTTYFAENVHFENQPPQFQLPRKVETRWEMDNDVSKLRIEQALTTYDENGNLVEQVDTNGITTTHVYYNDADEDWPGDPLGFQRSLKETTVFPSSLVKGGGVTLRKRYRYVALPALASSGMADWLAVDSETSYRIDDGQETELQKSITTHFIDPADDFLHGRVKSQANVMNGHATITNYEYCKIRNDLAGETLLQTIETLTGFDHEAGKHEAQARILRQRSLFSGQTVFSADLDNVQTLFRYDDLGRVSSETVSPGTPFEATRCFEYTASIGGKPAEEVVTDARKVKSFTRFDGLDRVIYRGQLEPATGGQPEPVEPVQTYEAEHDALGNMTAETVFDWPNVEVPIRSAEGFWPNGIEPLKLITRYTFNDWGESLRTIGPDGVATVEDSSPFGKNGPVVRSWQESPEEPPRISALNITEYNRFGKPDSFQRLDAQPLYDHLLVAHKQGKQPDVAQSLHALLRRREVPILSTTNYVYDGQGRLTQQSETLDSSLTRTTDYEHDDWDRMQSTTLPDKTIISRTFAEHSTSELPVTLQLTPLNQNPISAGTQGFDGLLRQTHRSVGPRVERYSYIGGQMQIATRTTPANEQISYSYEPNLTEQPTAIKTSEGEATYEYNPVSANIEKAVNGQGNRQYTYNAVDQLTSEQWTDVDSTSKETHYVTSLQQRPLNRSHTDGRDNVYEYDICGRVARLTQGTLQASFEYNALGQPSRTTTHDSSNNNTLVTELEYDTQEREIKRTLSLTGQPTRIITQTWLADNQLQSKHLQLAADGHSLLKEEYRYDLLNRLQMHSCSGEMLPCDAHGNRIKSQLFRFDALNNIQTCRTTFDVNGTSQIDNAAFTYATDDPCRLEKVTHTYLEGGYPESQTFEYDADGNMLNDERGQRLSYDSQGRLLSVKHPTQEQVLYSYRYDGHNHLVGVRKQGESESLRFYQGYRLSHVIKDHKQTQYMFLADLPLGEQQLDDHNRTLLFMTDASPSVIGECLTNNQLRTGEYSAFGERTDTQLQSLLAFNSEVREEGLGWYLLGRGYRAYNPGLMRFHTPDSLSPFGAGGVNPYVYCLGDPVNFNDPSGHYRTNGRPTLTGYVYPFEQPKQSFWDKWLPVAGLAIGFAVAIAFTPFTGGLSLGLALGVVGVGLSGIALGVGVYGTLKEDQGAMTAAMWLGIAGTALSVAGGAIAARAAAKVAAAQKTGVGVARGAADDLLKLPNVKSFVKTVESSGISNFKIPRPSQIKVPKPSIRRSELTSSPARSSVSSRTSPSSGSQSVSAHASDDSLTTSRLNNFADLPDAAPPLAPVPMRPFESVPGGYIGAQQRATKTAGFKNYFSALPVM
ncbi:RHS repeat domain-containing protein [Pseudomonas sp. QTF5]|uniref:RHS repeat domain-containing protein n=1 Tax=Pseudomonas sp. QTF5 TaxID=1435425 RepID=UPI0004B45CE6|nr:RHS repeat-associated core domain-containing protein [Pseudomonas sp. QTF5]